MHEAHDYMFIFRVLDFVRTEHLERFGEAVFHAGWYAAVTAKNVLYLHRRN